MTITDLTARVMTALDCDEFEAHAAIADGVEIDGIIYTDDLRAEADALWYAAEFAENETAAGQGDGSEDPQSEPVSYPFTLPAADDEWSGDDREVWGELSQHGIPVFLAKVNPRFDPDVKSDRRDNPEFYFPKWGAFEVDSSRMNDYRAGKHAVVFKSGWGVDVIDLDFTDRNTSIGYIAEMANAGVIIVAVEWTPRGGAHVWVPSTGLANSQEKVDPTQSDAGIDYRGVGGIVYTVGSARPKYHAHRSYTLAAPPRWDVLDSLTEADIAANKSAVLGWAARVGLTWDAKDRRNTTAITVGDIPEVDLTALPTAIAALLTDHGTPRTEDGKARWDDGRVSRHVRAFYLMSRLKNAGYTPEETVAFMTPWAAAVGKYAPRDLSYEVSRCWEKIDDPDRPSFDVAKAQEAAESEPTHGDAAVECAQWAVENRLGYSELEVADRFAHQYDGRYVYDPESGSWWEWVGTHWDSTPHTHDAVGRAVIALIKAIRGIEVKAASRDDDELKSRLGSTRAMLTAHFISNVQRLAEKALSITRSRFGGWQDRPDWLNTPTGLVNLRTLEVRPCVPADMVRRVTAVGYVPDANSEDLDATVARLATMDPDIKKFLQRWAGYSVTGYNGVRHFVYFRTGPAAGKSTLFGALASAMGEYAAMPNVAVFCKNRASAAHQTDFADLEGRRCVITSEPPEGSYFDDERLKSVTGADLQTTRAAFQKSVHKWQSTMTVTFLANDRMSTVGAQKALFARMLTIDIPNHVSDGWPIVEGVRDRLMSKAGLEAVLAWAAKGAHEFLRDSALMETPNGTAAALLIPESVEAATREYAESMDKVGQFIEDEMREDKGGKVKIKDVYTRYANWSKDSGYAPMGKKTLNADLESSRGWEKYKGNDGWYWLDVALT